MSGYDTPLHIPLISDLVSKAVVDFAKAKNIDYDLWYHDEPLWQVWRKSSDNFYQQVQIAAFLVPEGEQLFFIPQAYRFDATRREATPQPDKGNIQTIPFRELYIFAPAIPNERPRLDEKEIITEITKNLGIAWGVAESFKTSDLGQKL